ARGRLGGVARRGCEAANVGRSRKAQATDADAESGRGGNTGSGPARRSAERRSGRREGGSNSVVESQPSKLLVAGSIPVSRSNLRSRRELRLASHPPHEGVGGE